MEVSRIEIQRELKLSIINHFNVHPLYLENWTLLFKEACRNYLNIIGRDKYKEEKELKEIKNAFPTILSTIESIVNSDDTKSNTDTNGLKINQATKNLVTTILKTSGISVLKIFYNTHISSDESTTYMSEFKFKDDLSPAVFEYLKQKTNVFTIDKNNWPLLVSFSVDFLKSYSPPLEITRQKAILNEVLCEIINYLVKHDDKQYTRTCITPLIESIYNGPSPFDDLKSLHDLNSHKNNSNSKCCIIM